MAITKLISAREIYRRMYDEFNIKSSDFEIRAIEWIGIALRKINIQVALCQKHQDLQIINFRAKLPCDLQQLTGIEINGLKLDLPVRFRTNATDNIILHKGTDGAIYELSPAGYIFSPSPTGVLRVHYKSLPTEFDDEVQLELPLIPDDENVIDAVKWYVFYKWLGRGETHPVYSLKAREEHLNPYRMWIKYKLKAKNVNMKLNKDERELHSKIWKSFTYNTTNKYYSMIGNQNRIDSPVATTDANNRYGNPN